MKRRRLKNLGLLLTLTYCLIACTGNEMFSEFHSIKDSSWDKQDAARFDVLVSDTLARYHTFIEVRNNNDYPFANLWLFIDKQSPDGQVEKDTLNVELADVYGKWHGKGLSLYTLSVPYESNILYPDSGTYTYTIRHGMRENPLTGISDLGLKVTQ